MLLVVIEGKQGLVCLWDTFGQLWLYLVETFSLAYHWQSISSGDTLNTIRSFADWSDKHHWKGMLTFSRYRNERVFCSRMKQNQSSMNYLTIQCVSFEEHLAGGTNDYTEIRIQRGTGTDSTFRDCSPCFRWATSLHRSEMRCEKTTITEKTVFCFYFTEKCNFIQLKKMNASSYLRKEKNTPIDRSWMKTLSPVDRVLCSWHDDLITFPLIKWCQVNSKITVLFLLMKEEQSAVKVSSRLRRSSADRH